jgi:hypothetical protein
LLFADIWFVSRIKRIFVSYTKQGSYIFHFCIFKNFLIFFFNNQGKNELDRSCTNSRGDFMEYQTTVGLYNNFNQRFLSGLPFSSQFLWAFSAGG